MTQLITRKDLVMQIVHDVETGMRNRHMPPRSTADVILPHQSLFANRRLTLLDVSLVFL